MSAPNRRSDPRRATRRARAPARAAGAGASAGRMPRRSTRGSPARRPRSRRPTPLGRCGSRGAARAGRSPPRAGRRPPHRGSRAGRRESPRGPGRARRATRIGPAAASSVETRAGDDVRRAPTTTTADIAAGSQERSWPSAKAVTSAPTIAATSAGTTIAMRSAPERRGTSTTTARRTAPSTPSHSQPESHGAGRAAADSASQAGMVANAIEASTTATVRWAAPTPTTDVADHTRRARTRPATAVASTATTAHGHVAAFEYPADTASPEPPMPSVARTGRRPRTPLGARVAASASAPAPTTANTAAGIAAPGARAPPTSAPTMPAATGIARNRRAGAEQGEHGERSAGHHERDEDGGEVGLGAEPDDALLRIDLPGRDARGQSRREREEPEDESRHRRDGRHRAGRDERRTCVASNRSPIPGDPREQCGHRPRDRRREPRRDLEVQFGDDPDGGRERERRSRRGGGRPAPGGRGIRS